MDGERIEVWEVLAAVVFFGIGWFLATGAGKTQWVRLVDIFIYGPYLLWLAFWSAFQRGTYVFSGMERTGLLFLGATTISYNLRKFLA